jgi:Zn-dependent protease with chaperone function
VVQLLKLIAFVLLIPAVGFGVGLYGASRHEDQWLKMQTGFGLKVGNGGVPTFDAFCGFRHAVPHAGCEAYANTLLLQEASVWTICVGLIMIASILAAAQIASANRNLLAALFAPGVNLVLFILFLLILGQGAIAIYSVYILEVAMLGRPSWSRLGVMGLGAMIGAFAMIRAGFSISRRASFVAIGKSISAADQPRLRAFVTDIAGKLGARPPRHIVIGLAPEFYVTSSDVTVMPASVTHRDELLYLSLPLMRILSLGELAAVVGHELGHFRGEDTKFSLKFYPVYAGTTQAMEALEQRFDWNFTGIAMLPALATLSLFLGEFSIAESSIQRTRELAADKAGASVASARDIGASLLKIGAFAELWPNIQDSLVRDFRRDGVPANASTRFAKLAATSARPELIDEVAQQAMFHPTDRHPPTRERIEALGMSVSSLRDEALRIDSERSSALLLDALTQIEESLTETERKLLIEERDAARLDATGELRGLPA